MSDDLIRKLTSLENITDRYDDVIGNDAQELHRDCGVYESGFLHRELAGLEEEFRLLHIGIIGRVKAGKSSMLNSLFFSGKNVLPEAATPMTASLTLLTWGERCAATVEYFTAEDIHKLGEEHKEYDKLYEEQYNKARQDAEKKKRRDTARQFVKNNQDISFSSEEEERIRKKAARAIADESLVASHEQFVQMKKSPLFGEFSAGKSQDTFSAENWEELVSKLSEYVGANGTFTPFTKSVELQLPQDTLRNIVVVDTPGLNDPVVSRSERTNEYLQKCDVVLIVSPAGQFLTEDDVNLMDRLSNRHGIRELYWVVSKAGSELFGDTSSKTGGDLPLALSTIEQDLGQYARNLLQGLQSRWPETKEQFGQLLEKNTSRTIIASSMCNALRQQFNSRESWTPMMNHVFDMLKESYPDYFGNDEAALANLGKLDGISRIAKAIEDTRLKKNEILAQRRNDLFSKQKKSADDYATELINRIGEKISKLENTELADIQIKKKNLETIRTDATLAVDAAFEATLDNFRFDLLEAIDRKRKEHFAEAKEGVKSAESSEIRTRYWTTGWWIFKKEHSQDYTVTVVRAGAIRNQINSLCADLEDSLYRELERAKQEWKKNVQTQVTRALRETVNDDNILDSNVIRMAMRRQMNSMEIPTLDFSSQTFTSPEIGMLEGSDAESYIGKVQDYLGNLRTYFQKQTRQFVQDVENSVRKFKMSDMLFDDFNNQLSELEQALQNKQANLQRMKACQHELEEVANDQCQ